MSYYIYILFSAELSKFYVGYSSDPWSRHEQHLANSSDRFTGKAKDWILMTTFFVSNAESEAIRVERFIKKQKSRVLLEKLIDPSFAPSGVLSQLLRVPHVGD